MAHTTEPMTQGPIWKRITYFALPIFLGNLFQQMYNTVDSLVVGHFCGDNALAAVSSSGSLCFLIIGFFSQTSARLAPADVFFIAARRPPAAPGNPIAPP